MYKGWVSGRGGWVGGVGEWEGVGGGAGEEPEASYSFQ